jgi:glycosyltransferase involved in cell wall biosynthesis
MTTPRADLAVVLCTYNGGRYVAPQLRSILEQTVLPAEVLVYDDGSTDDTLARVQEEYDRRPAAAREVRLHIEPPDGVRRGAVGNFERGLRSTAAALVALADQDDVWHPDRLARGLEVLDADPRVDVVASNATFMDGEGRLLERSVFDAQHLEPWELRAIAERRTLPSLTRRNMLPGMTFLLRREFFERTGGVPAGTMHDYWLALCASVRDALAVVPDPLVDYRIHGANAVGLDAGDRDLAARFRARLRLVRTPLTDLAQWSRLADLLREEDPSGHLPLVLGKHRFEQRRRFPGQHGLRRIAALVALIRSGDYTRFDVGGWRGAVKDFLRPPAADPVDARV